MHTAPLCKLLVVDTDCSFGHQV